MKNMKRTEPIPVFHLEERASKKFELTFLADHEKFEHWNQVHRDDNFLLIFQQEGTIKLLVDFLEITIEGAAVFCLLPGQVHQGVFAQGSTAYALAVDSACLKEDTRTTLTEFAIGNAPVKIQSPQRELLHESLLLLARLNHHIEEGVNDQTLNSMLDVCTSIFAMACPSGQGVSMQTTLRPLVVTRQFRKLLLASFRTLKNPSEYAEALNVSASYLNECVKSTTGYPVSHWIHQEIMLEAKRMLFYTHHSVKEVADQLGYADPAYFIRLFHKKTGVSPTQFRSNFLYFKK